MEKQRFQTKDITMIGLMAALTCILGPLSITLPFTPVPISFTNLAIYFTVMVIGMKKGTISYIVYLLLGAAGLPIFSAFTGGVGKLAGPTGGYLVGFIFLALISGWFIDHFHANPLWCVIGMVFGTAVTYAFGTAWLCWQAHLTVAQGLLAGVIPYLPGDAVKIVIAILIGSPVRKAVRQMAIAA
ncbi:biotin transporter BioY [Anaerostipes sp. MSJ-23]|uniref:biotin transporter BioY n=1 Tax=unclassified Anaerostipes TaxID=2635253 RepID=UPI001C1180EC|nr:biotin transporter BioY [Anaerostipes sp. MSJ-23]MBU5458897.1 biotin transporter BioY [Anaerostipes sp. MSJ-23]